MFTFFIVLFDHYFNRIGILNIEAYGDNVFHLILIDIILLFGEHG